MNIRSRVEKLESSTDTGEPIIIVRHIVTPGRLNAPIAQIRTDDGQVFVREPMEDAGAFKQRAAFAAGWPGRSASLIAKPLEEA